MQEQVNRDIALLLGNLQVELIVAQARIEAQQREIETQRQRLNDLGSTDSQE